MINPSTNKFITATLRSTRFSNLRFSNFSGKTLAVMLVFVLEACSPAADAQAAGKDTADWLRASSWYAVDARA